MERLPHLILFLVTFLMVLASVNAKFKSIFLFGDSQFDPGNNQYIKNCTLRANFLPYGTNYFHYPTGRFTNGRTVADFLAQYLGIKFQKPYEEEQRWIGKLFWKGMPDNGLSFASAGSGLLQDTNKDAKVTPIQAQLQQYQSLIDQKHLGNKQIENSLFFIASGGNDIFSYFLYPGALKMTPRTYIRVMLKEVFDATRQIYKSGGRRIVLFSIGPMGCIPGRVLIRGASTTLCINKMDGLAKIYNAGLKRFVLSIPRIFPGAISTYAAVYDTAKKYRDNPKQYGFTNVTHACCGAGPLNGKLQCGLKGYTKCMNPDQYFFWDYFHPTERTYGLISKAFWEGGKDEIWPINLKTLASKNLTLPIP